LRVLSVVGARPQFIKASPVSRELRKAGHTEILVHTGQHYDDNMSAVFFRDLDLPHPDYELAVGSGTHAWQTGQALIRVEEVLLSEKPDWVLVYGDTNSTLAGALAAAKLHIPLAHVEAGLRSFNREMPEEHNRVVADHVSDLLFCPTETAVRNLAREGMAQGVRLVGDTMYDAVLRFLDLALKSAILEDLRLKPGSYLVATVHRAYNTDVADKLRAILTALAEVEETIVFPMHPRTRQKVRDFGLNSLLLANPLVRVIEPVGYLDMLALEKHARLILTDSGGMQKEAYFLRVPCLTLRPETEWVETVAAGWNVLVDADATRILEAVHGNPWSRGPVHLFGRGDAAPKIVQHLMGQD
jgi:UDP-N-acetylglucosamine 2-epimerase